MVNQSFAEGREGGGADLNAFAWHEVALVLVVDGLLAQTCHPDSVPALDNSCGGLQTHMMQMRATARGGEDFGEKGGAGFG